MRSSNGGNYNYPIRIICNNYVTKEANIIGLTPVTFRPITRKITTLNDNFSVQTSNDLDQLASSYSNTEAEKGKGRIPGSRVTSAQVRTTLSHFAQLASLYFGQKKFHLCNHDVIYIYIYYIKL